MRKFFSLVAVCVMAILAIALCGCDDLGAFADEQEYYDSFGNIVMISGTSEKVEDYPVAEFFYNDGSREDFLTEMQYDDFVYVAIPFNNDIDMDSIALYVKSQSDVTVYINVYVTDDIPENWRSHADNIPSENDGTNSESPEEVKYDDPEPDSRVGDITLFLKKDEWNSFVLEEFSVGETVQESIQIYEDQYVLLQIRNNSGVRTLNEEGQLVDYQTGLVLDKANIIMTNLLVRALSVQDSDEAQGGE